jgi:hypothetical protein
MLSGTSAFTPFRPDNVAVGQENFATEALLLWSLLLLLLSLNAVNENLPQGK